LTSRIKALRRALGDDGVTQRYVETRRGRGYRFIGAVVEADGGAQLLEQQPREESLPTPRTLEVVRHNLPVERTLLVGRSGEIDHIGMLLRHHRLVTLLGIGGTGKTRLATAVAADQADRYADGVWFVDLVPVTTREQVAEAIATAVGLQLTRSDVIDAVSELIADREMLIVLDNCEHITEIVADFVDELLELTNLPRWLTTSREPLQLPDERQVRVAPLAVDRGMASPAVQLFAAAAERVDVVVDERDVATIAYICGNLDGLPLSIELAAAQLRHLTLTELAARLDQRFELLARDRGGRMRRQASLQAVLDDTWEMLDDAERDLLLQLAAFASSFTIDDVDAVTSIAGADATARRLAGLVDRSLVVRDSRGRHRLIETVKLFARHRWDASEDPDVFLERPDAWMASLEPLTA
jgi:predicted ATPase